jgi:hypothetical protein
MPRRMAAAAISASATLPLWFVSSVFTREGSLTARYGSTPGSDGYQLAARIRARASRKRVAS